MRLKLNSKMLYSLCNLRKIRWKSGASFFLIIFIIGETQATSAASITFLNQQNIRSLQANIDFQTTILSQRTSGKIYTTISLGDIEAILQDTNLLYRRESSTSLRFDMDAYKIFATLQNCSDNSRGVGCKAILLQVLFSPSNNQSSLNLVNEWNRTKRGTRAYVDRNNILVLEGDIDLFTGVSDLYLKSQILRFLYTVGEFNKFL
ncbi:YbjN domain-containing protein [Planktothrix pseudagardhii]|uniref:Bacterial sensory transduction regulator n=1 Tax=Planktothrix pseudagardhii TaxID=132604 RepID=A0A9W4CSA7_9CYAN|nr:YbjN domain-containing protein [Planktothrix pseudagardhii]CAD5981609.1 Putative bacterial sensory transduction regulator [Planktothrix pseudagardhii]